MKLLSIDVETTGLDPARCGILEVGAVLFDPKPVIGNKSRWQFFECLVDNQFIQGEPYALQMNKEILAEICGVHKTHREKYKANVIPVVFRDWLLSHDVTKDNKVTIVGKNYCSFDEKFLSKLPGWSAYVAPLCERRVLDVGSLYFDPADGKILNLESCLGRIGVQTVVRHRALDDATDVATAVSRFFAP